VEGGILRDAFVAILRGAMEQGYRVVTLSRIAGSLSGEKLPERSFRTALLRGRAVPCAV